MRGWWILRGVKIVVLIAAAVMAAGFAVMLLWNWLMPSLFGWHEIVWLQAMGLLALGRILFGRFGGGMGWRHRMMHRWHNMSPEERERFQTGFRGHCGRGKDPASTAA